MARLTHDGSHRYTGYIQGPTPTPKMPGYFLLMRGTNFGDVNCKIQAFDVVTRKRFRGIARQVYNVTEREGVILHETRH